MNVQRKPDADTRRNESGIEIKPLYTAEDVAATRIEEPGVPDGVGAPGAFPFTRGIHDMMYRKRPWTMRQYTGFGNAEDTNKRFKYLIETGNTGLNVAFDLPTQCGYDSDDPMAGGEVGRVGMAIDTLKDVEIAFEGIDIENITVSLTINGTAAIMIAMYLAMAEKRGFDLTKLRGTCQNDILKEFVGRGTWIYPVEPSVRLVADTMEYCAKNAPLYSPVSVCGYHIRESGATPTEEMAYGFAIAGAYFDEVLKRGLDIDEFAYRMSFNYNIFGQFFEQICKFRAGRRLWAKIVKNKYRAKDPKSMWLRMIAGGGGAGLTIEQPENNIMRGAYYALGCVLSGAQTIALCCYDEAYTIPSEKAQRISLRTMQLLIEEMGMTDTVDPLAGSYFVETLTNQMEAEMVRIMEQLDEKGGIVKMIADGEIQAHVSKQAYERHKDLETGAFRKVGVNCHEIEEDEPEVEMHPYKKEDTDRQIARLNDTKASRDQGAVDKALADLKAAADGDTNTMPAIMDAVKAYASVGEITAVLTEAFGRYQEPMRF
ncbi:MAG TPA: methylmalonyl-CoA mutase family protein [Alphaproteobacteria bacterium]|nr:methylmalonyl-CoA mutase family protein [Alphaproteobacteria bacterium]